MTTPIDRGVTHRFDFEAGATSSNTQTVSYTESTKTMLLETSADIPGGSILTVYLKAKNSSEVLKQVVVNKNATTPLELTMAPNVFFLADSLAYLASSVNMEWQFRLNVAPTAGAWLKLYIR